MFSHQILISCRYHHHSSTHKSLSVSYKELCCLSEACRASTHDFTLTHQLSVEFGPIKGEIDVKVDTVKRALWRIHTFKVLFKVLTAKIRGQCDNFLDSYTQSSLVIRKEEWILENTYADPWCIQDKHHHHKHTKCPHTSTSHLAQLA